MMGNLCSYKNLESQVTTTWDENKIEKTHSKPIYSVYTNRETHKKINQIYVRTWKQT